MAKTANLYARIEPDLKVKAEDILDELGIPASSAITMFYKQIILHRGLPFDVTLPSPQFADIGKLTEQELAAELDKGYDDYLAGNTIDADTAFDKLKRSLEK